MADRRRPRKTGANAIERKLDVLSSTVDARFEAVDARFEAVDARFEAVDRRFDAVDRRFDAVDARFEAVDRRFDTLSSSVDRRFDEVTDALVEQRQYTEFAFDRLRAEMHAGFTRLERKLDQVIDAQLRRTN
jgi:DNA repair ATPase RecN